MSASSARAVRPASAAPGQPNHARPPRPGDQLPLFTLPDRAGRAIRLWDFKQRRPVVLAFLHGPGCPTCRAYVAALAARSDDLAVTHAAVLVIVPGAVSPASTIDDGSTGGAADPAEAWAHWADALTPAHILPLVDREGAVTARYLPPASDQDRRAVALYVADRYGACGLGVIAPDADRLPTPDAILAELAHADEGTCACLEPAWPAEPDGRDVPSQGGGS
jgi:hypothetical protein